MYVCPHGKITGNRVSPWNSSKQIIQWKEKGDAMFLLAFCAVLVTNDGTVFLSVVSLSLFSLFSSLFYLYSSLSSLLFLLFSLSSLSSLLYLFFSSRMH